MSALTPTVQGPKNSEPNTTTSSGAMALPTTTPQDWDETTIISSLARLETIQEQLDSLRQTMPLLVRSLTKPHDSPQDLYKDFRNITVQTQKKLINIKADWESKETKEIFERVKRGEVVKVDVEDIKRVPVYGWIEEVEGRRNKRKFEEGEDEEISEDGMKKVVKEYKARHEGITAEYKDDVIQVSYTL